MHTLAFFSQKGGCGKTTSCLNLAAALTTLGRRVLIIDLDSNACASRTFDVIETLDNAIAAALLGQVPLQEIARPTHLAGLWLAPGVTDLHVLETTAEIADPQRLTPAGRLSEAALALELRQLPADSFDYVLLDCPGGHPFMEHLALLACDAVIVPTGLSVYDLFAATPTLQLVLEARQVRGDGKPEFLGFLPNGAGKAGVPNTLQAKLGQYELPCLPAIRHSALLKTIAGAPRLEGRLLVTARPAHPAALSFLAAAREIERRLGEPVQNPTA